MKIGLALAGGGSLGAYQVGILKYLKEKNWHFDVVTGTSVGAINGALVVTDDIEELEKLWLEISNDKIMLNGMDLNKELLTELNPDHIFKFLKTFGTLKGVKITPFKELCKKYINPVKIQQSACEFGTICVDFPKLVEEKIDMKKIDEHLVLPFIHASSACYPVFPIEKINDKKYIDGFYKNNLPIDFCFALGADKVIAIDLGMFGTKPQNSYLIDLPNVIYLKPKINLGSFMDFRHEVIKKNIQRGYHDAQKYFKELLGSIFTFYPSSNLQLLAQKFIQYLVTNQNEENKTLMKYLNEMIKNIIIKL
ncbi:MAG: patatin-like phospholipase family protein [Bacilli bacterium]